MNPDQTFEHMLKDHGPLIARIAASYEADKELARDLTQEILLAVWRALPSFRADSSLRTFVARIAHNRAVTHIARAAKLPESVELPVELPCPAPPVETMVMEHDRQLRTLAAVQKLPLAYRQVATLTLEGFTPSEVALALGLTVNAVAIRSTRARALLRSLLGE
jgi:RNA polymerase sigma-70 factor (ECF subfamily)